MKADKIHAEIVNAIITAKEARLSQRDTVTVTDSEIQYILWNTPIITVNRQTGEIIVNNEAHAFSGTLLTKRRKKHIAQMLKDAQCATCNKPSDLQPHTLPRHHSFAQYCYSHGKQGTQYICKHCADKYTNKPYSH